MNENNQSVLIEQRGAILRIQLNRPQKKNALLPEMYESLIDGLKRADADPSIHVVYLTGSADSFTAGNDLKSFQQIPRSDAAGRFIVTISETETPIVAAVNGVAVGVGVTMLLHCDLVYAAESAIFDFAFINLGIVPEAGSTYLLPRMVGQRRAAELLMLGERFYASKAQSLGLVNQVVPLEDLEIFAWQHAKWLASKPPEALRMTKQLLRRGTKAAVAETIPVESKAIGERLASAETQAIIASLLNRRA